MSKCIIKKQLRKCQKAMQKDDNIQQMALKESIEPNLTDQIKISWKLFPETLEIIDDLLIF